MRCPCLLEVSGDPLVVMTDNERAVSVEGPPTRTCTV